MGIQESQHGRVVAEIEAVAAPGGRARLGTCSLEGLRLCERALRSGARVERAAVVRAFLEDGSDRATALRAQLAAHGCELHVVPDGVMAGLTAGRSLGGIIGLARLPAEPALDDVIAHPLALPLRILVCVAFNDPGNAGALVRTAHASGASAVIAVGGTDALHPRAIRTSMGSVFRLPVLTRPDVSTLALELRDAGVRTLAAVTQGGIPLPRLADRGAPIAVVLGSEAFGLSSEEADLFDERVTIPMVEGVDSFSVNAAAAVLLYELRATKLPLGP